MTFTELAQGLKDIPLTLAFVSVTLVFLVLYFGAALLALVLRRVLPPLGVGRVIDARPLREGQIRREVRHSLISIVVFGLYGVGTVWMLRHGWVRVTTEARPAVFLLDLTLVFLWNELHFYGCHRWLHRDWWMRRVHLAHHLSRTPTPFSTYAFHWFEAIALGSVMLSAMLIHDFHILAVLLLPVMSITGNLLGHLNYDLFPAAAERGLLGMSRRHGLHHARASHNYGFLLAFPDRIFGTEWLAASEAPATSTADPPLAKAPALVGRFPKLLVGAVIFAVTVVLYGLSNRYPVFSPVLLQPSLLDRSIPFLPWTAWIYASYPLLFITVYLRESNRDQLNRFLFAVLLLNAISELVFVLLPTTLDRSAFVVEPSIRDGGSSLLAWIQHIDTPSNCLPSLHVSAACLSALFAWKNQHTGWRGFVLWAVLIALSTLTTKQHVCVDVVSGAVLAAYVYWFAFKRRIDAPITPAPATA